MSELKNTISSNGSKTKSKEISKPHPEVPESMLWNLLNSIPVNLSVWKDGSIVYANSAFFKTAGVKENDFHILTLKATSEDFFIIHPEDFPTETEDVEIVKEELNEGKLFHRELRMKSSGNEEFRWYNTYVVRGTDNGSKITVEIDEDISIRKKMEDRLNAALKEKDILLKEVHHRVKNNFQIISSLLRMQHKNVTDQGTMDVLKESENRVRSIAMVHESLYNSANIVNIDFRKYIQDLVKNLVESYNGRSHLVKFNINSTECIVGVDIALPCSLIINELVSNSFKHGFDDSVIPEMNISFSKSGKFYMLKVQDNGVGFPDSFYLNESSSIGMMLVKTLVKQLGGVIDFRNSPGAEISIIFKEG